MVENQREEKEGGVTRDEIWSSFSRLKQRLPPCWLPVSTDNHGGGGGVDFSAGAREDEEGGRCYERGRRQWTSAAFRLALEPCCPGLGQAPNALKSSSWPPPAASSCWEAPLLQTRSWGRSPRRMLTRRCLWNWCTVCCQMTDSWPGAEWSPSPSPGRGLKTRWPKDREENKQDAKSSCGCGRKWGGGHHEGPPEIPCCSSSAFCRFRSSISCWCVWFFRLIYWMYSVALSKIWARDAC